MSFKNQSLSSDKESRTKMAAAGDLDAFNELVLTYQDVAYHHAYALLGDPALAEDVTQESFIKAFENMPNFHGGSFRGWLLKIVTNSAYDLLRRSHRHPMQPLFPRDENDEEIESPAWLVDPASDVQELVEQREFSKHIYQVLDEMPDIFRSVLTLIDVYELDYTEAAEALRVPLGTVKSRLTRARLAMQRQLKASIDAKGGVVPTNASIVA
jgi:RNA polymerase sigma-70 factor (ECF subfamily)